MSEACTFVIAMPSSLGRWIVRSADQARTPSRTRSDTTHAFMCETCRKPCEKMRAERAAAQERQFVRDEPGGAERRDRARGAERAAPQERRRSQRTMRGADGNRTRIISLED